MLEHELKMIVPQSYIVPDLSQAVPDATATPATTQEICDAYYDTENLRLARSGCTLRHRSGDSWTVKLPISSDRSILSREEIAISAEEDVLPEKIAILVAPYIGTAPLVKIAQLVIQRHTQRWVNARGETVVELADDNVSGTTKLGRNVVFRELEVEVPPNSPKPILAAFSKKLKARDFVDGDSMPKILRVLGNQAMASPDIVRVMISGTSNGEQLVKSLISLSVGDLMRHLPHTLLNTNPAAIHQARLSIRQLRCDLKTFSPLLDPLWSADLQQDLKPLANALGNIRNADVLSQLLRHLIDDNSASFVTASNELQETIKKQAARDQIALSNLVADTTTKNLFEKLIEAAAQPHTNSKAALSARETAPALVKKCWRSLRRAVNALPGNPTAPQLHKVRILTKRLRHVSEGVEPAIGKRTRKIARRAYRLQSILGDMNDRTDALIWLNENGKLSSPNVAFASGRFAQQVLAENVAQAESWREAYVKLEKSTKWLFK